MKSTLFTLLFSVILGTPVFAQDHHGNGLIQQNTERLSTWLDTAGPSQLDLPSGLTADTYRTRMKQAIEETSVDYTDDFLSDAKNKEIACLTDSQSEQKKIRCNAKSIANLSNDSITEFLHSSFLNFTGLNQNKKTETITNQLSDYMPDDSSQALQQNRAKRDEFLSKEEQKTVLMQIDETAGDTWAESPDFDYAFPKVECSRKKEKCWVTVKQFNLSYDQNENEIETFREEKVCQVKRVKGFSSIIDAWGFDLQNDFYNQLCNCIDKMTPPPAPRKTVDLVSNYLEKKNDRLLNAAFSDFWSTPKTHYLVTFRAMACYKVNADCWVNFGVFKKTAPNEKETIENYQTSNNCTVSREEMFDPAKLKKAVQACLIPLRAQDSRR